jgi:hypothetical protein
MVRKASIAIILLSVATASWAKHYKFGEVSTIDKVEYERSNVEDKKIFNCDRFRLKDSEIKFALKTARPVSERVFYEELYSIGCSANVELTFRNGDKARINIAATGRILANIETKEKAQQSFYYHCRRCDLTYEWGLVN